MKGSNIQLTQKLQQPQPVRIQEVYSDSALKSTEDNESLFNGFKGISHHTFSEKQDLRG